MPMISLSIPVKVNLRSRCCPDCRFQQVFFYSFLKLISLIINHHLPSISSTRTQSLSYTLKLLIKEAMPRTASPKGLTDLTRLSSNNKSILNIFQYCYYYIMSLIKRILIANRGEIACRIIHTAKKMNIETIAIYSDIDKNSKFVDMANRAYRVGPNPSIQSYLNSQKILEIAKDANCEALHPGFGFLSENASFAEQCEKNGIIFIGPPSSAIVSMGSKSQSKKIMIKANVPVVPGYHEENQDDKYLAQQAQKVGYPVLIKAVSGGGGKGMRIVTKKQDFAESLESCKRQSLKAFKDDRVIIQKYITRPRHIEVQVFGDKHKNYVHLYERDCSIQRRHQKVVEEAPSNITQQIRQSICNSAVDAAKAVGYYNAGTVEFIFDLDSNKHYFMEMNTRLQVEHPISEMITGLDFVQWQFLVASGFPLPKKQHQIEKKGNAIEVRIYSEDPFNNFLPGNGTLKYFKQPKEGNGVRIETGVRENDTISTFYDPMIAKLITYGKDRNQAISSMKKALSEYKVVGLPNNLKFLKRVISDPIFAKGEYDTSYIPQNINDLLKKETPSDPFDVVSAVIARYHKYSSSSPLPNQLINFRNVPTSSHTHEVTISQTYIEGKQNLNVLAQFKDGNTGTVKFENKVYNFEYSPTRSDELSIVVNGQGRKVQYFQQNNVVHLFDSKGDSVGFKFESDQRKEPKAEEGGALKALTPMPGTISKIFVKEGAKIKKGDAIFALEAMKMEHVIRASADCTVTKINNKQGDFVQSHKEIVHLQ